MPCVLSTANLNLKPVFPTFSLDKRGKKCMGDTWGPILPAPDLGPDIDVHNTRSDNRYFKHGNFVTPNNLYHPAVLATFLGATRLVQQCINSEQHRFEAEGENIEIVIVVRCISPNEPQVYYYVADHADQTIKWFHDDFPRCYEMDAGAPTRDCAEYWHHRSKFPVHKHCTSEDREKVLTELNGMLNQGDAHLSRVGVERYLRQIQGFSSSPVLTDYETGLLAEVYSEALKHSLPAFYSPTPSFKGKLLKSLFGRNLSMPRFVHNRTHRIPEATVSQVIQEHLRHPNHLNSPVNSTHTGDSPLGTPPPSGAAPN